MFRRASAALAAMGIVALTVSPVSAQDPEAPEQDNETIIITGHGWGHGRGMSQYGSAGYAVEHGWTSGQMLDHYYGGTTPGTTENQLLTVRIDSANDLPTVAAVDDGAMILMEASGEVTHVGTGGAVRLTSTPDGFVLADAPDCGGPFVDRPETIDVEQIRIGTATTQRSGGVAEVGAGKVIVGDWDGDGDDDLGVISGSQWRLWNDEPASADEVADHEFTFEVGSAQVVVGDWDGDGIDTPGTFDGAGNWSLLNGFDPAASPVAFAYGTEGDQPVVGDWDGDGDTDHGVRRQRDWLLSTADGAGAPTIEFAFGRIDDVAVVGDWDGDGVSDPGVVRNFQWIRQIGFVEDGETLPTAVFEPVGKGLIGDWDGDGIDHLGSREAGSVDLEGPLGQIVARSRSNLGIPRTIQRCVSANEQRYYRGELRAVANDGNQRTVNAVPVESYLRAVVPLEMPASWAALGEGAGAAAVEVQAVSARSYALAENRASYARTCDTISCQVYGGRAVRIGGVLSSNEHPLADRAILDTAGVVRFRDGEVARTEFSSSTGGWTAGGVFPAVEDLGDSISINPNHDWTTVLSVAQVEARFSERRLDRIEVTARNGLGRDGGRVEEVELTFGEEVFTMSGNDFRRAFGLKSDWYTVDWERISRRTDCVCPEDWPNHGLDEHFLDP